MALGLADDASDVEFAVVLAVGMFGIGAPFFAYRQARPILTEAVEIEGGSERHGPSVVVAVTALLLLAPFALALALTDFAFGYATATAGASFWWLCVALRLRAWERRSGRRLLYRPVYRWAGTGNRVLGRGWFDPANFVSVPR